MLWRSPGDRCDGSWRLRPLETTTLRSGAAASPRPSRDPPRSPQMTCCRLFRESNELSATKGCLFRCPHRSVRSVLGRSCCGANFFPHRLFSLIENYIVAGGGRPYFFTPWTDRPRTDRTDRWGHRNKHPLVAESSLDSRNNLQHVIWGDLGGRGRASGRQLRWIEE